MWEENKFTILLIIGIFVVFFIFIARPHQLDSLLSAVTPEKDRVAVQVLDKVKIRQNSKPTETLEEMVAFIQKYSGVSRDEAIEIAKIPSTQFRGGLLYAEVVASEVHTILPGQRYLLFTMVDIPQEKILVVDYEPDIMGYIFYPGVNQGEPQPIYISVDNPELPKYLTTGMSRLLVAMGEVRKRGYSDWAFFRRARRASGSTPTASKSP